MGYIYILTNTFNNKQYVGMTKRKLKDRLYGYKYNYKYEDRPISRAITKYGYYNFDIEYFECANNKLLEVETEYIKKLNTLVPNGYNVIEKDTDRAVIVTKYWNEKKKEKYGSSKDVENIGNETFIDEWIIRLNKYYKRGKKYFNIMNIFSTTDLYHELVCLFIEQKQKTWWKGINRNINNIIRMGKRRYEILKEARKEKVYSFRRLEY